MKWQSSGPLGKVRLLALLAASLVIVGCKLQVVVPPGGRVVSESGNFSCEAGESCTVDVTDVFFDETFRAIPDPGYTFVSWRQRLQGWCGGRNAPCRLTTTGFVDTPLLSILNEDYVFYLQPIFAKPDRWSELADLPHPGVGVASCVINGKLYVVGGGVDLIFAGDKIPNHNDEYDPVTNTWRSRAEIPSPRNFATASAVNGKCYVIGGGTGKTFSDPALTTVQAYDPQTNTWENRAPLPEGRHAAASAVVDSKIYVIGGGDSGDLNGSNLRASVAIYDPRTNLWRAGADMPTPRRAAGVAAMGQYLYVVGGVISGPNGGRAAVNTVERYDSATNQWNRIEPLPESLHHASAVAYQGELYVFGGIDSGKGDFLQASSRVYRYRPQNNSPWESPVEMPTPRWGHTSAVLDRQIYLVGGSTPWGAGAVVSRVEQYTPEPSVPTPARAFHCNSAPPIKETDADVPAEGLYSGTLFNCARGGREQVLVWVDKDRRFRFFPPFYALMGVDGDALHQLVGSLQVDGNRIQGNGLDFAPLGRNYFSGGATGLWMDGLVAAGKSLAIDGSDQGVEGGQNLEGRWGTEWGDYGYFSVAKLGLPDSSKKAKLAGAWHGPSVGYSQTVTWDFDADELIKGQDTMGCEYRGQLRLMDSAYLVYKLDVTVTGCEVAGVYSGILHQQTGGNWGDFLSVSVDDGRQRSLFFFFVDSSWD